MAYGPTLSELWGSAAAGLRPLGDRFVIQRLSVASAGPMRVLDQQNKGKKCRSAVLRKIVSLLPCGPCHLSRDRLHGRRQFRLKGHQLFQQVLAWTLFGERLIEGCY